MLLAERLKKKGGPGNLYKASTDNMLFFNRDRIFTIYKRAKLNNGEYLFWVEEDGKKINGRFLRQELFKYLNLFLGRAYYRDINLHFVYNTQYKQWFSSGPEFFNEAICKKVRNKNFNLKRLQENIIMMKRKEMAMQLAIWIKRKLWEIEDI